MLTDREIYESVCGDLLRFASVLAGRDAAPDIVSTVVTRVLANRGSLTGLREPHQYLMAAVANEARSVWRVRSRELLGVGRLEPPVIVGDIARGRYPDVTDAVMSLPHQQRSALYLMYWVGMTSGEAAKVMRCRPATVRRYLTLARRTLKERFDD